jgi:hypothetical protein
VALSACLAGSAGLVLGAGLALAQIDAGDR